MKKLWKPVVCRFAKLEFLRGEWRRYNYSLLSPGEYSPTEVPGNTEFDLCVCKYWRKMAAVHRFLMCCLRELKKNVTSALRSLLLWTEQSLSLPCMWAADGDAHTQHTRQHAAGYSFIQKTENVHPCWSARYKWRDSERRTGMFSYVSRKWFQRQLLRIRNSLCIDSGTLPIRMKSGRKPTTWKSSWTKLIDANSAITTRCKFWTTWHCRLLYFVSDGNRIITVKGSPNLSNIRWSWLVCVIRKMQAETDRRFARKYGWMNCVCLISMKRADGPRLRVTAKLADLGTMTIVGNQQHRRLGK